MKKQQQNRRIVMITGTPGVGKHTVTKHLAQMAPTWKIIDVNESARRAGLLNDYSHTKGIAIDTDDLYHIMKHDILAEPGDYVVIGHLAPYVTPQNDVILAVILRRNPYDLAKTYRERGYSESKSLDNTGAEVLGTIAYDTFAASYASTRQYDTTGQNPKDTAHRIFCAMRRACGITHDTDQTDASEPVDWLCDICNKDGATLVNDNILASADTHSQDAARRMLEELVPDWPRRT